MTVSASASCNDCMHGQEISYVTIIDPETYEPHDLDSQSVADAITLLDETITGTGDEPTETARAIRADLQRMAATLQKSGQTP